MEPGQAYIGDRYYGADYQLFGQLNRAGIVFVSRLREDAVIVVQEELPVSPADRAAGVLRQAWAKLGGRDCRLESPMRVVVGADAQGSFATGDQPWNLPNFRRQRWALLYRQRWQIELFFRWIKCNFGLPALAGRIAGGGWPCRFYLALIAALLLQLYTGQRPNRRMMELIQFYFAGSGDLGRTLGRAWSGNAEPWRLAKILKIS